MDRFAIKKKLYAGLGDYARQRRGHEMKKKYGTGSPQLDAIAASQDEAIDSAELPSEESIAAKIAAKGADVSDIDSGAEAAGPAIDEAMHDMGEDEEMAKWMAKQRG